MTNDSSEFFTADEMEELGGKRDGPLYRVADEEFVPLYEDWMIWHFDHRAKSHGGVVSTDSDKSDPAFSVEPRYWVRSELVSERRSPHTSNGIGFRNRMRAVDVRSCIASVIPPWGAGNTLPVIFAPQERELVLAALLSSLAFDFLVRQKASGMNLNFFIVKQIPLPTPEQLQTPCPWDTSTTSWDWLERRAAELILTADDLGAPVAQSGGPYLWNGARRAQLASEIEAASFHLFGFDEDATRFALESFEVLRDRELRTQGHFSTLEHVMEQYRRYSESMLRERATGGVGGHQ